MWGTKYSQRLSKKSEKGYFSNFACNEINYLHTSKSMIKGFSTVSQYIPTLKDASQTTICGIRLIFFESGLSDKDFWRN